MDEATLVFCCLVLCVKASGHVWMRDSAGQTGAKMWAS